MDLFDNNALNMPMVALRGLVVFPNITLHFDVGRKKKYFCRQNSNDNKAGHISFYTKGYVG
ncbi:MAG: hypothetical protein ACLRXK_04805 [Acutalibacteraceae bacterium]